LIINRATNGGDVYISNLTQGGTNTTRLLTQEANGKVHYNTVNNGVQLTSSGVLSLGGTTSGSGATITTSSVAPLTVDGNGLDVSGSGLRVTGGSVLNGSQIVKSTTVSSAASGYQVTASDYFIVLSGTFTGTLDLSTSSSPTTGRVLIIKNKTGGSVTTTNYIDEAGTTLNSISSATGDVVYLIYDGSAWQQVN
jgi:hypothetical protein